MSTKQLIISVLSASLLGFGSTAAMAAPVLWESDFGAELTDLTGEDDEQTLVSLSFDFTFAGVTTKDIWVGTNGALQFDSGGEAGDDDNIDYDFWAYFNEFADDATPTLSPFNTDLSLSRTGTIHFKDFGNRAAFTWNEVGTAEQEKHLLSFQALLYANGDIVFSYNGILDGPGEDLVGSLSEGILVGISESLGTDDGTNASDLSSDFSSASTTIYELWCYETADSCENRDLDLDLDGPINSAFDLDQKSIIFSPNARGGYDVSTATPSVSAVPLPASVFLLGGALAGLMTVGRRRSAGTKA